MTTIALIFFAWVVLQALCILAACALVKRKNPFKRTTLPAKFLADEVKKSDLRMERECVRLARTLKRIHP